MSREIKKIYCCGCESDVQPSLTDGAEIYPHRHDLSGLPFWKCDTCGNCVGCHHKTKNRTAPIGCIPTPEIKRFRQQIHRVLDPLWKSGSHSRRELYARLTELLGWTYHTAKLKTASEAQFVLSTVNELALLESDK